MDSSTPPPGLGYFVRPPDDEGPGVLLLPSPWGLTPGVKHKAHDLADAGFTVLVPDLNDGAVAADADHARQILLEADTDID